MSQTRNPLKIIITLGLLSFFTLNFQFPISAQSTGIEVSPAYAEVLAKPGDSFSGKFSYKNNESTTISGELKVAEIIGDTLSDKPDQIDVEEWITFENPIVTLESGATQEINYSVKIPQNLTLKTYEILILLDVKPEIPNGTDENVFGQNLKIPFNVRLTISSDNNYNGLVTITKLDVKTPVVLDGNINIELEIQNVSESITKPMGRFQIVNLSGNQIYQEVLNDGLKPLNSKEKLNKNISFKIDHTDVNLLGQYKVQLLVIDTLNGKSEIKEADIFVISWPFIILGVVIFFAIYTIIYGFRKNLSNRQSKSNKKSVPIIK